MVLRVRAARPQDRASWCELSGRAGPEAEAAWWDAHQNDPSWRLLVAENGRIVGKTAARLVPNVAVQVAPPRVRKGAPVDVVAQALLESALLLKEEGPYPAIEFRVADRIQDADLLRKAAEKLGFAPAEEHVVVERDLQTLPRVPMPFSTRTLDELGDDFFLPVFKKADEGRVVRGKGYRAEDEWAHVKSLPGFDPKWAFLATKTGDPVGYAVTNLLAAPTDPAPRYGTVSYMGVLPAKRRSGYGTLLHSLALANLWRRGATHYRDTVDAKNVAMRAVARKNGCVEVGHEWVYRRAIVR